MSCHYLLSVYCLFIICSFPTFEFESRTIILTLRLGSLSLMFWICSKDGSFLKFAYTTLILSLACFAKNLTIITLSLLLAPPCRRNTYAFRKYSYINLDKFKLDILNPDIDNLDSLIEHFHSTMKSILGSHTPVHHRNRKAKPVQP